MLIGCLKSLGFKPALIGLDDQGANWRDSSIPKNPPRSIPLNLPVFRFFKFVHRIQEYLTLADDPAKLAEYDPEAKRALRELGEINEATKRSLKDFCAQCLDIHGHYRPSVTPAAGPRSHRRAWEPTWAPVRLRWALVASPPNGRPNGRPLERLRTNGVAFIPRKESAMKIEMWPLD